MPRRIIQVRVEGHEQLDASQSVFVMAAPDIESRDPSAQCSMCGRRGTVAYIATGSPIKNVERYCRRCWPAAQRRDAERSEQEFDAMVRHGREFAEAWRRGDRGMQAEPPLPPPRSMGWHWSVIPGTLLRLWWFNRRRARKRRNPVLVLLPLLFGLTAVADAQPKSPNWVHVETVDDTTYYLDSASVSLTRGGTVQAWIRHDYARTILSRTGIRYDSQVTRVRIDCARRAWTSNETFTYNGSALVRRTSSKPQPITYSPRRPQDRTMLLLACGLAPARK